MKAVMISIQPKWCELIANGEKTVEVRKTRPKIDTPFKCYIYCTYGKGLIGNDDEIMPNFLLDQTVSKSHIWGNCCNGKVIGEFVCDKIEDIFVDYNNKPNDFMLLLEKSCLSEKELFNYSNNNPLYAWHISDLKIYDNPKELREFRIKYMENVFGNSTATIPVMKLEALKELTRPPQSWCYCEELEVNKNE